MSSIHSYNSAKCDDATSNKFVQKGRKRLLLCLKHLNADIKPVPLIDLQKSYYCSYNTFLDRNEIQHFFGRRNLKCVIREFMEDVVEIIDEDSALFFKLMNFNLGEENQHKSPILSKADVEDASINSEKHAELTSDDNNNSNRCIAYQNVSDASDFVLPKSSNFDLDADVHARIMEKQRQKRLQQKAKSQSGEEEQLDFGLEPETNSPAFSVDNNAEIEIDHENYPLYSEKFTVTCSEASEVCESPTMSERKINWEESEQTVVDEANLEDEYSYEQLRRLESVFLKHKGYPQPDQYEEIARKLGLSDTKVQIWFKNRLEKERRTSVVDEAKSHFIERDDDENSTLSSSSSSSSNKKKLMLQDEQDEEFYRQSLNALNSIVCETPTPTSEKSMNERSKHSQSDGIELEPISVTPNEPSKFSSLSPATGGSSVADQSHKWELDAKETVSDQCFDAMISQLQAMKRENQRHETDQLKDKKQIAKLELELELAKERLLRREGNDKNRIAELESEVLETKSNYELAKERICTLETELIETRSVNELKLKRLKEVFEA